jgi:uncharacterized protein (DUF433 family)
MATVHHIDTIVSDPGVRGGQPIIAGTTIRVSDLVASHLYRGLTPEELAVSFDLNLAQVYAALAYYYQHKAEVDEQMRSDMDEANELLDDLGRVGKLIHVGNSHA